MAHCASGTPLFRVLQIFTLTTLTAIALRADSPAFDLTGPRVDIQVTRGGRTLPIANVARLQEGDRLWIHPQLPAGHSVHYLLVIAFLRGSTNPPPEQWFSKLETWDPKVASEGARAAVPPGAQQALLFLAPDTSGGFGTLRSAVRAKPGVFVRAVQDLNQAARDRSRLDKYLEAIREISNTAPAELHDRSVLLAKTLNIKLDQQCFDRPTEQQGPCLMKGNDALLMDNPHSLSLVASLTSGPSSDLIGALGASPAMGGGNYGPYVGAVMDLARLLGSLHTAEYQYIPALAMPSHEVLNLRLNNPPSFRKPESVMVVGLPAITAAAAPSLRIEKPEQVFCLEQPQLALPVEGSPLAYSTELAHDFTLRISGKAPAASLPVKPDASHGGFVVDAHALKTAHIGKEADGKLEGYWGFDTVEGPTVHLRAPHTDGWSIATADRDGLVAGRDATLHLDSSCAVCTEQVTLKDGHGKDLHATWKLTKPGELELHVSLKGQAPGELLAAVKQYGSSKPEEIKLRTYDDGAHIESLTLHTGETEAILTGKRLEEIASVEVGGTPFAPGADEAADGKEKLVLAAGKPVSGALPASGAATAHVTLRDGRTVEFQAEVEPARPKIALLSKKVIPGPSNLPLRFSNPEELSEGGRITFFVRSDRPQTLPRTEKIEVATEDGTASTLLSTGAGTLMPQDSRTTLAVFEPLKGFGPSAFGPLRFRAVDAAGNQSDWQPLGRLVRVPSLKEVRCPASPDEPCKLAGSNLFLIDSISADAQFSHPVSVPQGYLESTLTVPRPNGTLLYVKLRDDPAAADTLILPVLPEEQ